MNKKPTHARISETRRYTLMGAIFGFLFPVTGTLLRIVISQLPLNIFTIINIQSIDPLLWVIDTAPLFLGLFAGYAGRKQDLLLKSNEDLNDREHELITNQLNLEQHVKERTAELSIANQRNERRSTQFEAIARTAHAIRSSQTLDTLLPQIAETISAQFGFYHIGIFLLDNSQEYAILVAANSEGGKRRLEQNHRLLVGETGIVGFVIKSGQPRVVLNVGLDAAFFNNPDLPDSHSEIVLPLRGSSDVFGALDVQSIEVNAFSQEDVSILSSLADQVSIAIQNARSLQESREALAQVEATSAQSGKHQWHEFLYQKSVRGYTFDGIDAKRLIPSGTIHAHSLAIPLTLRGVRIGTLKLNAAGDLNRKWTNDEIAIAQATADRTTLALESARLLQESQRQLIKEQMISEVTGKIGTSINLKNILQTAVEELGRSMPGSEVMIKFQNGNTDKSEK